MRCALVFNSAQLARLRMGYILWHALLAGPFRNSVETSMEQSCIPNLPKQTDYEAKVAMTQCQQHINVACARKTFQACHARAYLEEYSHVRGSQPSLLTPARVQSQHASFPLAGLAGSRDTTEQTASPKLHAQHMSEAQKRRNDHKVPAPVQQSYLHGFTCKGPEHTEHINPKAGHLMKLHHQAGFNVLADKHLYGLQISFLWRQPNLDPARVPYSAGTYTTFYHHDTINDTSGK